MKFKKRNLLFVVLIMGTLIVLSLSVIFKETKEISNEEARYLTTFESLVNTSYLDGSFQNTFEEAYTDQFVFRNQIVMFKKGFDYLVKDFMLSLTDDLTLNKMPEVNVNQIGNSSWLINMIVEDTPENEYRFKTRAEEINALQERHPDVDIYVYMPTQVHDTDIFDAANGIVGGGPALTKIFKNTLEVPYSEYQLNTIDDYYKAYYMSDHHPNNVGADIFYQDIVKLLDIDEEPLRPTGEDCHVGTTFLGTFARQTGFISDADEFCIYTYDLPDYDVYSDGILQDYQSRNDFVNYDVESLDEKYPYWYGIAYTSYEPIMEFDSHQEDKENLLIIGDSYSSSIADLLASHFNHTYRVMPYNVEFYTKQLFNYDKFIVEHDIDKVVFMLTFENYYYQDEWGDRWAQNAIVEVKD